MEHTADLAIKVLQAEQKAHNNIADKMSGSFGVLACTVVEKSEMLDSHTVTISALTVTVTDLTATKKAGQPTCSSVGHM